MATTATLYVRNTTKGKEKKIHKILLQYGYTSSNITDKGVLFEVEADKVHTIISEINEIQFGIAEKF